MNLYVLMYRKRFDFFSLKSQGLILQMTIDDLHIQVGFIERHIKTNRLILNFLKTCINCRHYSLLNHMTACSFAEPERTRTKDLGGVFINVNVL
jgi:hypothetical protein